MTSFDQVSPLLQKYAEKFSAPGRALDLGCGNGANSLFLADKGFKVTALDEILPPQRPQHSNIRWVEGDILNFDFSGQYEVILALNILQFLEKNARNAIMEKIYQALKPGGWLLIKSYLNNKASCSQQEESVSQFCRQELVRWSQDKKMIIISYQEDLIKNSAAVSAVSEPGIVDLIAKNRHQLKKTLAKSDFKI